MRGLLLHLFRRGVTGRASAADLRTLDYLVDAGVNRRVFGQPLSSVLSYYLHEYVEYVIPRERWPTKWREVRE